MCAVYSNITDNLRLLDCTNSMYPETKLHTEPNRTEVTTALTTAPLCYPLWLV